MTSQTRGIMRGMLLRISLSLLLAVILIISLLVTQLQRPVVIPTAVPNGDVAFVANRDGAWDIFLLDSAGEIRNLTAHPAGDYFPSWSFGGDRLNFLSARGGDEIGPAQMNPDGSDARSLGVLQAVMAVFMEGRLDWDPQWSPDGRWLAWASVRDLNLELYVQALAGDEAQRLTADGARDWFPAWSPDSARLAFASDRAGAEDIYVIDIASGQLTRLTDHPANDIYPVWSLDGARIAFVTERERALVDGEMDVFVMNTDGSDQRRLAPDELFEGGAVYAPDGSQVIILSNRAGRWGLYLLLAECATPAAPDDDCLRQLTPGDYDALFAAWRP